jgi:hypothetical protein
MKRHLIGLLGLALVLAGPVFFIASLPTYFLVACTGETPNYPMRPCVNPTNPFYPLLNQFAQRWGWDAVPHIALGISLFLVGMGLVLLFLTARNPKQAGRQGLQ